MLIESYYMVGSRAGVDRVTYCMQLNGYEPNYVYGLCISTVFFYTSDMLTLLLFSRVMLVKLHFCTIFVYYLKFLSSIQLKFSKINLLTNITGIQYLLHKT